jgi:hypothetical protein
MTIDHADVGSDSDEQSVVETTRNNSHIQDRFKNIILFRIWYSDTIHDFGGKRNKIFPGEGPIKLNPF